jgi:hypothetical protein
MRIARERCARRPLGLARISAREMLDLTKPCSFPRERPGAAVSGFAGAAVRARSTESGRETFSGIKLARRFPGNTGTRNLGVSHESRASAGRLRPLRLGYRSPRAEWAIAPSRDAIPRSTPARRSSARSRGNVSRLRDRTPTDRRSGDVARSSVPRHRKPEPGVHVNRQRALVGFVRCGSATEVGPPSGRSDRVATRAVVEAPRRVGLQPSPGRQSVRVRSSSRETFPRDRGSQVGSPAPEPGTGV